MGQKDHTEMLRQARILRARAKAYEPESKQALTVASDPDTHPDVLDILATEEGYSGRPKLVHYLDEKTYTIAMAIVRNPSTRIQTLERMKTVKEYREYLPKVADALREELVKRPATDKERRLSRARQMALATMYWWMYGPVSGSERDAFGSNRPKRKRPLIHGPWRQPDP